MKELLRPFLPRLAINYFYHLPRAFLAKLFYGTSTKDLTIIGVTGTDGKTTTTNMIYQILKAAGKKVSMVSTINAVVGEREMDTGFHVTSPDPFMVQKLIKQAKKAGSKFIVLEVTSHALDQFRFWGVEFNMGIITNVTHEHLDYHKTFENYFKAKAKLIKNVKVAILNKDEDHFSRLSHLTHGMCKVVSFGLSEEADFNPKKFPLNLKIPGEYNLLNALASVAVTKSLGIDTKKIKHALENFESLPGRMQEVPNNRGIKIIIDFAHTPNGLEQVLKTLRAQNSERFRVIAITGAEGFRDIEKRPMMGETAQKLSNAVILTAVDPRGQLNSINQRMVAGAKKAGGQIGKNLFVIDDRQEAIDFAINELAKKGDTVGIFGKGHEKSMNLDGKHELPWSDEEAVRKALWMRK